MARELHYVVYETPDDLVFAVGTLNFDRALEWREEIEGYDTSDTSAEERSVVLPHGVEAGGKLFAMICAEDDDLYLFVTQAEAQAFVERERLTGVVTRAIVVEERVFMERPL